MKIGAKTKVGHLGASCHGLVGCSFEAKIEKRCKPPLSEVLPHASSGQEGGREGSRPLSAPEGQTRGWHANRTRLLKWRDQATQMFLVVMSDSSRHANAEEVQGTSEGGRRRKSHGLPDTPVKGGWCNTNRSWHPSAIRSGCG